MRKSIVLLAAIAVAASLGTACGSSSPKRSAAAGSASTAAQSQGVEIDSSSAAAGQAEPDYDSDDDAVRDSGHAATGSDARAIKALVERYYAAGARGDGSEACALTSPILANTVPSDYEQDLGRAIPPGGIAYLRGSKTCAAVLSQLFAHLHGELADPVDVVAIRLRGSYGFVLVDSPTLPASMIEVGREGASWRIDELLGRPLP